MARTNAISAVAGVLVAVGVFIVLQAWTVPNMVLGWLDSAPTRHPAPEKPLHTLAVKAESVNADPIVTEADVTNARVRGPIGDAPGGVVLELTAAARDRLAAAAKKADDKIAVTVDDKPVYTKPASAFAGDAARTIDLPSVPPLEYPNQLSARFGGALQPAPAAAVQGARGAIALLAGIAVLALVRIITGR